MENGHGGAPTEGVLVPVSEASDAFQTSVLDPLKSAYLYDESRQCFSYKSAVLINNPLLEEKYNTFRAKRREAGYSDEDLKESYGFLLFDNIAEAHALGETGVLTGNSTCTALGDPANGVYISMYSDCLDPNRWYHEKSGYIVIIRLTKGRIKNVVENYTRHFTAPARGFDCHVSQEFHSVSAKTSSFVAFERTQCYMYELLGNGNHIAHSPSAACPFAIVSFSYKNVKRCQTLVAEHKKSEEKELVFSRPVSNYTLWCGRFHIGSHVFDVALRSAARASIPAQLPPVVKVNRGISMSDLRQLLPGAVFETCSSSEVFQDALCYSLYEFVSSKQGISLAPLLTQIKEKDIALTFPLIDGGFLILLHSSHFLRHDDNGSSVDEVLLGLFLFRDSRLTVTTNTDSGQVKPVLSSELLHTIPALDYAESKVKKYPSGPHEELSEVFVQHMQSYAALTNPKLASSPQRDFSVVPDQYDVPASDTHLYSRPDWTCVAWQNFKSYLDNPDSFQLPVSKVVDVLAAGQEESIENLNDDDYFFVLSPEEVPDSSDSVRSETQFTGKEVAGKTGTSVNQCGALGNLTDVPEKFVPGDMQPGNLTKDIEGLVKSDERGTEIPLSPSSSDDLPAEMIVSITSAKRTASDADKVVIPANSAQKRNDFELFGFSAAKLEMEGMNSLNDETATAKHVFDCPELTSLIQTKRRSPHGVQSKSQRCVPEAPVEAVAVKVENDDFTSAMDEQTEPQLNNPSRTNWRRGQRRKERFATSPSKNRKTRSATASPAVEEEKKPDPALQSFETSFLMELEALPLKRKTERGDLKPVISDCGRILVPHGSEEIADQIKNLKDKFQCTKEEPCDGKSLVDANEQETSTAAEESEAVASVDRAGDPLNIAADHSHPEDSIWRQTEGNDLLSLNPECPEVLTQKDCMHVSPLKTEQETHMSQNCSEIRAAKTECLLNKLKSVICGKRKAADVPHKEEPEDVSFDSEPSFKKHKDDCMIVMNNNAKNAHLDISEVPRALSVDPVFAHALGLTPKETPDKKRKSEAEDTKIESEDSPQTQGQNTLNKNQIKQSLPSISPRRGRIKMLRKHQGISEEYVKKNWWLHFQTPSCYSSEQVNYTEGTSDNSETAETAQENSESTCSSTDALNLLADLALGASKDEVPPQPDAAVDTVPKTSVKNCDHTKAPASQSVLHTLLRQPSARPSQPLESPPPCHLVGGSELVGLVYKEHDYSLPPSSSPLLDLSGALSRVSPLYGSTGLLKRHHTVSGSGMQMLHSFVINEDRSEHNSKTTEARKNRQGFSRKFKKYRTIIPKDGTVQVTMECKRKYNFNRDGRLHTEPKAKAIIRGLHGPWDYSNYSTYQEKKEEQLIRHIWIGLFYSRSTARFFNIDPDETDTCSEGEDDLEKSSKANRTSTQSEPTFVAPWTNKSDSPDRVLDLSRKNHLESEKACDDVIDLSQDDLSNDCAVEAFTSNPQVAQKKKNVLSPEQRETSAVLTAILQAVGHQMLHRNGLQTAGVVNHMKDGKSVQGGKRTLFVLRKVVNSDQPNAPGAQGGGTIVLAKGDTGNASYRLENHPPVSGTTSVLHGCSSEKGDIKGVTENSEAKDKRLIEKQGMEEKKEVDSNKKDRDDGCSMQQDDNSEDGGNDYVIERKQQELSSEKISEGDEIVICNGNPVEDEESVVREEDKTVSVGKLPVQSHEQHESQVDKDGLRMQDGLERETVNYNHLNDRQVPVTCSGPDVVKDLKRPTLKDSKDNSVMLLRNYCADVPVLSDEQAISEKPLELSLQCEPIPAEPAAEKLGEETDEDIDSDLEVRSLHIVTPEHSSSEKEDVCPPEEGVDSDLEVRSLHIVTPEHSRSEEEQQYCPPKEDADVMRNLHMAGPEHAYSEKESFPPSGREPDYNDSLPEEKSEHYMRLSYEEDNQNVALDLSMPQMKDPVKTGGENKGTAGDNLSSREDQREAEVELTEETVLKSDKTNEGLEKIHSQVESLGIDMSGEDAVPQFDSHSIVRVEEVQKHQETHTDALLPSPTCAALQMTSRTSPLHISEVEMYSNQVELTTSRTSPLHVSEEEIYSGQGELTTSGTSPLCVSEVEVYSNQVELTTTGTSPLCVSEVEVYSNQVELTTSGTSPLQISETDQDEASESEFDDRCPTPTLDEEPCQYMTNAEPLMVVTDVWCSEDINENTRQCLLSRSSSLEKDEMPLEQNPKSTIKEPSHHSGSYPDLEERTQRVLQSVERLFSKSSPGKTSDKHTPDCLSSHISKRKRIETPKHFKISIKASSKPAPREREVDGKKKTSEKHSSSGLDYYKRKTNNLLSKAKYASPDPSYHRSGREERREKRSSRSTRRPHEYSSQSAKTLKSVDKSPHRSPHKGHHSPHKKSPHESFSTEKVGKTRKEHLNVGIMDDRLSLGPDSSMTCTIFNTSRTSECLLEHLSQRCLQDDLTQASLEQDWLIFADRMKQMVRKRKREPVHPVETKEKHRSLSRSSPVSVDFSSLEEPLEDSVDHWPELPLFKRKIKVDMSDRDMRGRSLQETEGYIQPAVRKNFSMILPENRRPVTLRRNTEQNRKYDFCDQVIKEMSERFQSHLTSVVKSCQSKYKFYIHVTSDDPLFEETKARLEAEGHTAVQPSDFLPCEEQCSSLLVILRNADIAEHICEVPHLLELKKSPDVQFAGIDEAEDVVTQTHQELFLSGGFTVLDRAALDSLSLCNMKKLSEVLQELNRKGKWKWMLHYRDFRWLKENARFNAETEEKKLFLNWCQQEGILEVLPYHECDKVSGARPDYLSCLVRLQVQNISARHAVFITDTEATSAFRANGILTMTCNSFMESFSGKILTDLKI